MKNIENVLKSIYSSLNKPVLFFDCETTGLNANIEDIVQLYVCSYDSSGFTSNEFYFNTEREISPEALSKHKLSKEFLSDFHYFNSRCNEIWNLFNNDHIICGYNHVSFDIPMLIENLLRSGIVEAISLIKRPTIDVLLEYRKIHTNELEKVFTRITGEEMNNAHNAVDDIYATSRILEELIKNNEIVPTISDKLDISGFFINVGGFVAFAKGKHKDILLKDINRNEVIRYLSWIIKTEDISNHTKLVANKIKYKYENR